MDAFERIKKYLAYSDVSPISIVSAPGRIDFLNTHQDYKGLPVVPIAINLRIYFMAVRELENIFLIKSLDLNETRSVSIHSTRPKSRHFSDYVKACLNILSKEKNFKPKHGYEIIISSDIPIGGGMGSSGAFEVAFIKLISKLYHINLSPIEIAELAYRAENEIMKIPCGRLDQYASAIGGTILLYPKYPPKIDILNKPPMEIMVVDSGVKHETANIHPVRQQELNTAIMELNNLDIPRELRKKIQGTFSTIKWEEITEEEISRYIDKISEKPARRFLFTIRMNELTKIAVKILKNESLSIADKENLQKYGVKETDRTKVLCEIVNKQHELLRDLYEVSIPEIEKIIDRVLEAGASAAKISGAGLGGCIIVLSEERYIEKIKMAALDAGASRVWHVKADKGVC